MESEQKFGNQNIGEIFYNKDGKMITFEELKNGFSEMMTGNHITLEHKIRFLIKVYLVDKKLFSKAELNSDKAEALMNRLYKFFIAPPQSEVQKIKPVFPKSQTVSMVRQSRLQQLREKKRAGLTEEGEEDIFGQTVKQFDESKEK